jgi:anti-anti-sigma factor
LVTASDTVEGPAAPDGGLRIDVGDEPGGAVLAFVGDLDLAGVPAAEGAIHDALARPGDVTIDLSRLEFIGSEGIRVVLRARERAGAQGRALRVVPGEGAARRLIEILGLADQLGVEGDPR